MTERQVEIQYWNRWEYKILNSWINFYKCPEMETKKQKKQKVNHCD